MKLKPEYITQEISGVQFLIGIGQNAFNGIIKNNETAAFIVDCLKKETDENAITEAMKAEYDADESVIREDVHRIIEQLKSIGALEGLDE